MEKIIFLWRDTKNWGGTSPPCPPGSYAYGYVFFNDESLVTLLPNVINCICNYTNSISTQSIITYSSLANIAPGFSMVEHQLVFTEFLF